MIFRPPPIPLYFKAEYKTESDTGELIKSNKQLKQETEERPVTEQALNNFQRLLQIVVDTIEREVFIKDTNGKYLFVNKAFGKDFGVDPEEVIRRSIILRITGAGHR